MYRERVSAIDLVIIDAIMPGLSGKETVAILKDINPQVKAILASGYSLDELSSSMLEQGICAFIQKPFRFEDLAKKIKEALNSSCL